MHFLLISLWLPIAGGLLALVSYRHGRLSRLFAVGSVLAASSLGIVPALHTLAGKHVETLRLPWSLPLGSYWLALDGLSAFFVLPIFILASVAAVYGASYVSDIRAPMRLAASWFFYNLLLSSMLTVVLARNGMLFLMAWEAMAVASFFLVIFHDTEPAVRKAGWTYLVASHIGTAFLLVMFLLLGRNDPSLDFQGFGAAPGAIGPANLVFLLAVVGFGMKAGFVPLHVWLPEAHPAAPSHVSAIMSGVMIKMGIYGLVRVLMILDSPQLWWGGLLVGIGAVSGILGVLLALAQHDLKKLLAYHSVENIGIITLGLGIGLIGRVEGNPLIAILGFGGALFHVFNHALFKGLLFLAAGAVAHGAKTRDMDHLGGLLKRMPWTGRSFLIGSVAICGLPPLNGFFSEFLIYLSAFAAATAASVSGSVSGSVGGSIGGSISGSVGGSVGGIIVIISLALIGGLATACFTKAFGIVFLGEPRSHHAAAAHEADLGMRAGMIALAVGCIVVGLLAPFIFRASGSVFGLVSGSPASTTMPVVDWAAGLLRLVVLAAVGLILLVLAVALTRRRLLFRRPVGSAPTWDCGYAAPTARMQYTSSSFARPLTSLFGFAVHTRRIVEEPRGLFPDRAVLTTVTPDLFQERVYTPVFSALARAFSRLRWLQGGRMQLYVLYIAVTLLILLVWKLG